ncbi:MAG: hypothetical protein D5R96_04115 [Methanocalculus sp. MSAO_Arc2]|nr:MAG: hypothetical protein D5R96_04115 [Methanocalculus sp. MSAO_Arc2]
MIGQNQQEEGSIIAYLAGLVIIGSGDYPVLHKPIYSPTAYSSILNAHLAPGHFRALVMWFRRD